MTKKALITMTDCQFRAFKKDCDKEIAQVDEDSRVYAYYTNVERAKRSRSQWRGWAEKSEDYQAALAAIIAKRDNVPPPVETVETVEEETEKRHVIKRGFNWAINSPTLLMLVVGLGGGIFFGFFLSSLL